MLDGEVPGTLYSLSDNSWMDSNTFDHCFANHFLVHVSPVRPLMLLLDGHSNPLQSIRKATSEGILLSNKHDSFTIYFYMTLHLLFTHLQSNLDYPNFNYPNLSVI